jgi:hypothetical protein
MVILSNLDLYFFLNILDVSFISFDDIDDLVDLIIILACGGFISGILTGFIYHIFWKKELL